MKLQKRVVISVVSVVGLALAYLSMTSPTTAKETSTEYEISVPAMKSDTQRMVEAYERLSDQYLSLVQNQLTAMAASNREVLSRLDRLERKLDELSAKLDALRTPAPAPVPAVAVPAPNTAAPATQETPAKP